MNSMLQRFRDWLTTLSPYQSLVAVSLPLMIV
jgi:hypothetical protein